MLFSLLPLPAAVVQAQGAGSSLALEEVIVTARKREESLQDVPIAITAVSGDSIRSMGIENLENLSQIVPNFFVAENTTVDLVGIRGLHSGVNFGFEQAVGQVVDGFFYGRSRLTRVPFLDVERVEVLKGPQGALIGKNTTAGAINITTRKPTEEFEGWVSAEYQTYDDAGDGYTIEGAVSGPVADGLSARLALLTEQGGGWVENPAADQDQPDQDHWLSRLTVLWQPSDDFDAMLQWSHADMEREGQSKQLAFCSETVRNFLVSRGLGVSCGAPDKVSYTLAPRLGEGNYDRSSTELDMFGLTLNWQLGRHTLTSLTGWAEYTADDNTEGDRTELEIQNTRFIEDYEQWSQELRLASPGDDEISYIAGLYISQRENNNKFSLDTNFVERFAPAPVPFPVPVPAIFPAALFSQNSFTDEEVDTYAVFGQVTWQATEHWAFTLDGRYTREDKSASQVAYYGEIYSEEPLAPVPIPPPLVGGPPFFLPPVIMPQIHTVSADRDESDFSPGFVAEWTPDPDTLVYGSVRRGFKGGGFNHGNLDPQSTVDLTFQFDEEDVLAYELGSKLTLLDGAALLNIAVYYMDFDGLQVSTVDTRQQVGAALVRTTNAASATSQGFEIDGTWVVTEQWRIAAGIGYNEAEYDDYPDVTCYSGQTVAQGCMPGPTPSPRDDSQDLSGKPIANAPEWSGVFNTEYQWPIADSLRLTAFAQALYRDEYFTLDTLDPKSKQDAYWKYDARLTLADADDTWELSLIGRNLSDELTSSFIQPIAPILENPSQTYNGFVDPGRSWTLQAQYRF